MGQVTVTIADKIYRIACDDGQEAHLMALAAELDRRIDDMRQAFGEIGDSRLTVMSAIACLDERAEMRDKIASLEAQLLQQREAQEHDVTVAIQAVDEAANRIESVARMLMNGRKD